MPVKIIALIALVKNESNAMMSDGIATITPDGMSTPAAIGVEYGFSGKKNTLRCSRRKVF